MLIRREAKPPPIGDDLAEEMVDFYIELAILVFAVTSQKNYFKKVGCCLWEGIIYGIVHPATWV